MLTTSSSDSWTSALTAMMIPPMAVIGAAMAIVVPITTSICTCCTSFVMRVISDGVPSRLTSCWENDVTWWKRSLRTSRPNAMAVLAPKYTAVIDSVICARVTASISAPVRQM